MVSIGILRINNNLIERFILRSIKEIEKWRWMIIGERLTEYVEGVLEGKDGSMLYNQYKEYTESKAKTFEIFYNQLQKGFSAKKYEDIR